MTTHTKHTPIDNHELARITGGYHDQIPSPRPITGGGVPACPPSNPNPNPRPSPVWVQI